LATQAAQALQIQFRVHQLPTQAAVAAVAKLKVWVVQAAVEMVVRPFQLQERQTELQTQAAVVVVNTATVFTQAQTVVRVLSSFAI
jgi:Mg2+ and Co2+ transporter CorA